MNKSKLTGILLSSAAVLTGAGVMHHAPAQAQQSQSNNHIVLAQRSADTNTSKTAVVIDGNGSLVLRAAASSGSAVSSYLSSGQMLTINSQSGAFYNVTVHETGATGYISANNIQIIENGTDDAFNALNEYGQVVNVSSNVHLRANASLNSSIIGFLQNGNTFKVLGKEGQWFKVDVDGTVGFIYQEYVSTSKENLAPTHISTVNNNKNTTVVNNNAKSNAQQKNNSNAQQSNNNTKTNNVTATKVQEKQEQANTKTTKNENNTEAKANSKTNKNVKPQAMSFFAINVNNNAQQSKHNNSNAQQNNNNNNNSNAQQNNNNNSNAQQSKHNNSNAQQNNNNNSNAQQNNNNNSNAQQNNNNNSNAQQNNNNNSNAQQSNNNNSNAQQNNNNNNNAQQSNNNNSNSQVSNGNVTGQEIVNYAEQFLGRPYVWGATGPNAFDCSGLTSYVYRHFGYNIGRTTYTQVDQGTPVSLNNLQPGDLIFWGPASAPYHVAIYIGGGEYIQAPHPGENVDISSWNLNNISAARRIL